MNKSIPSFYYIFRQRIKGRNFLYEFYFKNKKTIDIGCGGGEFLRFDTNLIHGIDLNKEVIDQLLSQGLKVRHASVDKIPYADNEFDMVRSNNVIEHLVPVVAHKMLCEAARVLKKGGLFVLSSETITGKFWGTFGHVRPYPPYAIKKLLREKSREEFEPILNLEWMGVFYMGDYYPNKLVYLMWAFLGYFTPLFRREYYLILRKK